MSYVKLAKRAARGEIDLEKEARFHRSKYIECMNALKENKQNNSYEELRNTDPMFKEGMKLSHDILRILTFQSLKEEFSFGEKRLNQFWNRVAEKAKMNAEKEHAGEPIDLSAPPLKKEG